MTYKLLTHLNSKISFVIVAIAVVFLSSPSCATTMNNSLTQPNQLAFPSDWSHVLSSSVKCSKQHKKNLSKNGNMVFVLARSVFIWVNLGSMWLLMHWNTLSALPAAENVHSLHQIHCCLVFGSELSFFGKRNSVINTICSSNMYVPLIIHT